MSAAATHPEIATITVGTMDTSADLRRYAEAEGIGLPVVIDVPDGSPTLMDTWGVTSIPALVRIEADGTVAASNSVVPEVDVEAVFDAFAAGQPLP